MPTKVFCLCMMIISSLLYAAIFGHVTTIIHNMTAATAKYHEMLSSVKEFMMLGWDPGRIAILDAKISEVALGCVNTTCNLRDHLRIQQ